MSRDPQLYRLLNCRVLVLLISFHPNMIITGDNPKQPIKGQNSSANPSNAGPSADLPPSYGATQSTQPYPQSTQPYRPQVQAYPAPPPVIVYRQSPGRRFCRAFVFAVLIWFLISLLVQSMFGVARWTHRHVSRFFLYLPDIPID